MKTRVRRKFFKCLEPLVGTNVPGNKSKRSGVHGTETDDYSLGSGGGGDDFAGFLKESPEKSARSFSRVIKAVLFEKSLMRKFRKKGSSSSTSVPLTSCESSPETDHKTRKYSKERRLPKESWGTDESLGGNSSDSSETSLFSSSTTASISGKSSRSASERKIPSPRPLITNFIEPRQSSVNDETSLIGTAVKESFSRKPARNVTATTTKRYNNNSNVMWFFVLSLMALVFWGKTLAILCTSAWLYMVPRFSQWVAHSPEIHSDEVYRSKIVKERMPEQTSFSRRLGARN